MAMPSQIHQIDIANALQGDVSSPCTDRLACLCTFQVTSSLLFQMVEMEYIQGKGSMTQLQSETLLLSSM